MKLPPSLAGIRPKLLLSYLLVIAVGIGALVLGVAVIAPSLFDRLLLRHMGGHAGMMNRGMTGALQRDTQQAFRGAIFQSLVLATLVATLAAIVVSAFVSRRIIAPITHMAQVSQRIADGDYAARVEVGEPDEIGDLAVSLNEMASALEEAEQRRVHLIGDVAHEIRTPLATLRGYLEGLADGVIEPSAGLWEQLQEETSRLQRLIDDLQELSRVEAGQIGLQPAPLPPRRLVETSLARVEAAFAEKGVALQAGVGDDLPEVMADEGRALQVLTNLLTNALRYTPAGGSVTVTAAARPGSVRFEVRDTGIGIAPEHLPRIFDRFYRADPARSRAQGGSGVGLTIARALVQAQGGTISAESAGPGLGSTFSFTLPCETS